MSAKKEEKPVTSQSEETPDTTECSHKYTTNFEEMKKSLSDAQDRLLNDPRTKKMIESGQHTLEEVKRYIYEQMPQRYTFESPANHTANTYTWHASFSPIIYQPTSVVAARNSIFEVFPPSALSDKIKFRPRLDAFFDDQKKQIVILVDLPGMEKSEIDIEIDDGYLSVSGTRTDNDSPKISAGGEDPKTGVVGNEKGGGKMIGDRMFGFFYRRFRLPENIDDNTIKAGMKNGVLDLRIQCTDLQKGKKKVDVS